jgi:type I restriction-modification system DNA methylase subunit
MINRIEEIKSYRSLISQANKELIKKEHFKNLLVRLFDHHEETKRIIDVITSGAEKAILNIPRQDKLHRGSADTLYNKVIIEFENDLKKSLAHAKVQLAGYLLGEYKSGNGSDYVLIASDMIDWRVYTIAQESLERIDELREDEVVLSEIESSSFKLKDGNEEDFYFWIDRILFKEGRQPAKLKSIEAAFGHKSIVFREAYLTMEKYYDAVKDAGEIQVSYEQWKKSLSIAYDNFNDTTNNFLIHTYLSLFSKMLAYQVLSNDNYIDDDEMRSIIDGSVFHKYNINNFVENDFFSWIRTDEARRAMKDVFRRISQELSTFDFAVVDEDVLKGVYQELVDTDTKHKLGEYYTPDWLCERVVAEFDFKPTDKILDPSCGSGSFLRAVIDKLKRDLPDANIEDINAQIHGIDIHPLSVQIAKTTVLLALGKKVRDAKTPIHLNIILANTLLTPKGVQNLFSNQFNMEIDKERLSLDTAIFDDANLFDKALDVSEELAEQTANGAEIKLEGFTNNLKRQYSGAEINEEVAKDFYQIYKGLKKVKETGRDSIWKFIVQNLYKPYFLKDSFDYIIGNPPWFTYSSIRNESYQDTLDTLAKDYEVKPAKAANYPHLEIAAIFLAYCSSYFLKDAGEIAFVLPRSFFSADHHDNTRRGIADGFILKQIWDLDKVAPLFRVPCCVLFGEKAEKHITPNDKEASKQRIFNKYTTHGIAGKEFSGALSVHNCNWDYAAELLTAQDETYFYLKQGNSSAFSKRSTSNQAVNPYKKLFKQGATIVPRTFYFVELNQDTPPDYNERIINVKTAEDVLPDAKMPWKSFTFADRIESRFLFRTALSKSILPFALYEPNLIALPLTVEKDDFGNKQIKLHSAEDLLNEGFLNASRWFSKTEKIWNDNKTEKSEDMTANNRLNFQYGITEQNLNDGYLVLYNSSAKDANATIVKREDFNFEFIVDHKTYVFFTSILNEAYYLTAILNSAAPNEMMKDFQSRGLFGARDIHKKILDIYYPRYDESDATHLQLAALSETAHQRAVEYLKTNPPQSDLTPMRLGKLRLDIKRHLTDEMREIDELVETIIK